MFSIDTNPKTNLWGGTPQKGRWGRIHIVQEAMVINKRLEKEIILDNVFSVSIVGGLYIVSYVDNDVEVLRGGTHVREYMVPIDKIYSIDFNYSVPTTEDIAQAQVLLNDAHEQNEKVANFFSGLNEIDDDIPQG